MATTNNLFEGIFGLVLDKDEAKLLVDVLDQHIEGLRESIKPTTSDPQFTEVDKLLEVTGEMHQDMATLEGIKREVMKQCQK